MTCPKARDDEAQPTSISFTILQILRHYFDKLPDSSPHPHTHTHTSHSLSHPFSFLSVGHRVIENSFKYFVWYIILVQSSSINSECFHCQSHTPMHVLLSRRPTRHTTSRTKKKEKINYWHG